MTTEEHTLPAWRKSSRCSNGACVEVATLDSSVMMRDSKESTGPSLTFSHAGWADFLGAIKDGQFDAK